MLTIKFLCFLALLFNTKIYFLINWVLFLVNLYNLINFCMLKEIKISTYIFVFAICVIVCRTGTPDQWKSRTIYQLLTDRFARSDGAKTQCSNLGNYCGGGYKGIINNLDYIQGMGFDAIWISPIV